MPWPKVARTYTIDIGKVVPRRLTDQFQTRTGCSVSHLKEWGKEATDKGGRAGEHIKNKTNESTEKLLNLTQEYEEETEHFLKDLVEDTEKMFDEIKEVDHEVESIQEKGGNGTVPEVFVPHMHLGSPDEEHTIWDDR